MKHILSIVEQLDRAANELSAGHPVSHRLALILIDNVAELIIHRRCQMHASAAKAEARFKEPNLSIIQRRKALGVYLSEKTKILQTLGDINELERSFLTICHGYRNEIYHVGLRHEDIIQALAGEYYLFVCDIFQRMRPDIISWSSGDVYTPIAKKYLSQSGISNIFEFDLEKIVLELENIKTSTPSLNEKLSEYANDTLDQIEKDLEFLVADNPAGMSCSEVLMHVQFHHIFLF